MGNNTQSLPTFSTIMIRDFDDERRAQPRHRGRGRGNEKPALVLNAPWDGRRAHRSSARGSATNQHLSVQELLIKTLPSARRRALYAGPGDVNRPYNMPAEANETAHSSDSNSILPLQLMSARDSKRMHLRNHDLARGGPLEKEYSTTLFRLLQGPLPAVPCCEMPMVVIRGAMMSVRAVYVAWSLCAWMCSRQTFIALMFHLGMTYSPQHFHTWLK